MYTHFAKKNKKIMGADLEEYFFVRRSLADRCKWRPMRTLDLEKIHFFGQKGWNGFSV